MLSQHLYIGHQIVIYLILLFCILFVLLCELCFLHWYWAVDKQEMNQIADLWDMTPCILVDYEPIHSRENVKPHM